MSALPLWLEDKEFMAAWSLMSFRTLVDQHRCWMLWQIARRACLCQGIMAEVGVYKGGTAKLLARARRLHGPPVQHPKKLLLFDTFQGLPPPTEHDRHKSGDFNQTSVESMQELMQDELNVQIVPGLCPTTAEPWKDELFCFVHIDVDMYSSVKDCCAFFWPRLAVGGHLVFDDYGFPSCPGAKIAVDEFFAGDETNRPIYLPTGQAIAHKRY